MEFFGVPKGRAGFNSDGKTAKSHNHEENPDIEEKPRKEYVNRKSGRQNE